MKSIPLGKLPDDALEAVLRHLSLRPRSPDWATHIPLETVCALCEAIGEESSPIQLLQRRVRSLSTLVSNGNSAANLQRALQLLNHCTRLDVAVHVRDTWLPFNCRLQDLSLTLAASASPPDQLLSRLPHLKVLRADVSPLHAHAFYGAVSVHCGGLEELELHVGFRTARGLSAMLSALGALRRLTLFVRDVNLPDGAESEPLAFVPLFGGVLEELAVHGDLREARYDVESLVLRLPNLRRLTMPHIGMHPTFPAQIATDISHLQVQTDMLQSVRSIEDYLYGERDDPTWVMQTLGAQLTSFALRGGFNAVTTFPSAAASCTALRVLSAVDLGGDALSIVGAFFASPRPALRELRLAFSCQQAPMEQCLRIVSNNTGGIESLELAGTKQPTHVYALLAQRNAQLGGVRVVLRDVSDWDASVAGVLDAFGALPALSTLTLDTYPALPIEAQLPRDVWLRCRKLGAKLVDVRVDGKSTR